MAKEAYSYGKRGLFIWQRRRMDTRARPAATRNTFVRTPMAKEAYSYDKRGLHLWQKRPIHMTKEAYSYDKRGLFT
jgi:hypothetical protein